MTLSLLSTLAMAVGQNGPGPSRHSKYAADCGYLEPSPAVDGEAFDPAERAAVLERLRAGLLTKAEVDTLIEQGLTEADLMDPYAAAPIGITTADEHVDPKSFNFIVKRPAVTEEYLNYAELRAHYDYLPDTWDGPFNKEQTDANGAYIQQYYPALTDRREGVEYEVNRLSYHDTTVYRIGNVVRRSSIGRRYGV